MDADRKVKVTAKDFAAKFRSKREIYNFLSVDVGVYLPAYGKCLIHSYLIMIHYIHRIGHYLLPQGYHAGKEEE